MIELMLNQLWVERMEEVLTERKKKPVPLAEVMMAEVLTPMEM